MTRQTSQPNPNPNDRPGHIRTWPEPQAPAVPAENAREGFFSDAERHRYDRKAMAGKTVKPAADNEE